MRSLLLLRHAKSSWEDGSLADSERPLAPRGRKATTLIADELVRRDWIPDHVLVSPSRRTRETWAIIETRLHVQPVIRFPRELYDAPARAILGILKLLPDGARKVLVIGHNPGMEELARDLSGAGSDKAAFDKLRRKFPTAAVARFAVEEEWATLGLGRARLTDFIRPRDL